MSQAEQASESPRISGFNEMPAWKQEFICQLALKNGAAIEKETGRFKAGADAENIRETIKAADQKCGGHIAHRLHIY